MTDSMAVNEMLERLERAISSNLRVAMPAKVLNYNAATKLARVQIIQDDIAEDDTPLPAVPIDSVPVMFPGAGAAMLSFPIPVGSEGWIMFADRNIAPWAVGSPPVAANDRSHDLTDAVFFPCFPTATATPNALVLEGGGCQIVMSNGTMTFIAPNGIIPTNTMTLGPGATMLNSAGINIFGHNHFGDSGGQTGGPKNP